MNARVILPSALLAAAVFGQDIHLKTRTIVTQQRAPAPLTARASTDIPEEPTSHLILQFDHAPGVEDMDSLAAEATLVGALPDNAVIVSGRASRLATRTGIRWMSTLQPGDKLSPALPAAGDEELAALVEFHADVDRDRQDALLTGLGFTWERPAMLLQGHVLMRATRDTFTRLAAEDEVDYIFPADAALSSGEELSTCGGMLTMSGAVAQYANIVHGWDLDSDHAAHLWYVFGAITPKIPAATVQAEVLRAMNEWSRNAGVVFQPGSIASAARTVAVKFVSGAHGDSYPFDGPGGTLAHTFYPVPVNPESIAGDVHLDADEKWHAGGDVDIYSVALHELGHAIGLGHSDKPGDVMYPYYRRGMVLSANDIAAAQILYGTAPGSVTAPPASVAPTIAPLRLSVDPVTMPANSSTLSITGAVSGGESPWSVQWQSDQSYSGRAVISGSGDWSASGISLVNGSNSITFTAFDAAHRTASQTVVVNKTQPQPQPTGTSVTPVSLSVTTPAGSVITINQAVLSVSGKASGGTGIARVSWQTAAGDGGTAVGTDRWTAAGIPLLVGTNTVVLRAFDARGASAWASLVVVRR